MKRILLVLVAVGLLALTACESLGFGEHHKDPSVVVNVAPVNNGLARQQGDGTGASDSWASGDTSEGPRSGTSSPTTTTEATATVPAPGGS